MNFDPESFTIHEIGETTQKTWAGTFKARKFLTRRQVLERDRILRSLLGDNPQYSLQIDLAGKIADCQVALVEAEEFWKASAGGLELLDQNVVDVVHEQVMRIQNDARQAVAQQAEASRKALKEDLAKPEKDDHE